MNLNYNRFPVDKATVKARLRNAHALICQSNAPLSFGEDGTLEDVLNRSADTEALLLNSIGSRFGQNTCVVALTSLSPAEESAVEAIRNQGGHIIALDQSNRVWLNEDAPVVVRHARDIFLSAEAIGEEITRIVTARESDHATS